MRWDLLSLFYDDYIEGDCEPRLYLYRLVGQANCELSPNHSAAFVSLADYLDRLTDTFEGPSFVYKFGPHNDEKVAGFLRKLCDFYLAVDECEKGIHGKSCSSWQDLDERRLVFRPCLFGSLGCDGFTYGIVWQPFEDETLTWIASPLKLPELDSDDGGRSFVQII